MRHRGIELNIFAPLTGNNRGRSLQHPAMAALDWASRGSTHIGSAVWNERWAKRLHCSHRCELAAILLCSVDHEWTISLVKWINEVWNFEAEIIFQWFPSQSAVPTYLSTAQWVNRSESNEESLVRAAADSLTTLISRHMTNDSALAAVTEVRLETVVINPSQREGQSSL